MFFIFKRCDVLTMFQKIAKHRANDASNDVHRPPLHVGWIVVTLPHVANVVKPKTTTKTTIRRKIEGIQQELLHSVLNACCETLYVDSSVFPVHISKGKTILFIIQ